MRLCVICGDKHYAKDLCLKHYYLKNKDKIYETARQWKKDNLEHNRKKANEYYQINKEKILLKYKERYYKDIEKSRKYRRELTRKLRKNNLERYRENQRKWAKNNPEKRLQYDKNQLEKIGKSLNITSMAYSFALRSWSKTIRKLDNNMCKLCDSKTKLNAHHILPKNEFPELSLNLDNGITLCRKCHTEVHGFALY